MIDEFYKILDKTLPPILGILWFTIIVGVSLGGAIWSIKWILSLLGVI